MPVRLVAVDGKPVISEVAEAAAFAEPALRPGLEITHIDGRAVAEILEHDVYPYVANCNPQNRDRQAFKRLIQGKDGSEALVSVRDIAGEARDLKLTRLDYWQYPKRPLMEYCDLGEGVFYVALNRFNTKEIVSRFDAAFEEIRKAKGLIFDVRENGGGSSSTGYAIIGQIIDKPAKGSLWKTRKYMPAFRAWGEKEAWHVGTSSKIRPRSKPPYLGPVIVLTSPGTVSAAEDFVVALHAAERATLVGERTAGTTGQPVMIDLPRGGKARICSKRDTYPDGREFVGVGVIPDIEVHPTQQSIAEGRDLALDKAIDTLVEKLGIDAASVSDKVASTPVSGSEMEMNRAELLEILKKTKTIYDALAIACAKKDWEAVNAHGNDLSDILEDELLDAFQVERDRKTLKERGRLNQQTEFDLRKMTLRKQAIDSFFANPPEGSDIYSLLSKICELSDDIHDCARDKQYDEIPEFFDELQKGWSQFAEIVTQRIVPRSLPETPS